ncbi:uncharacterized protein N7500_002207 [Penicillium coprophilum]|uniref:uncharacterized protein n=1 Tax=Penicillium coprophilum TaxID=36646 RepID=UPI00238A5955|nr:uncharacterized protein N7500_002207 [Penicillium coprophilum]KAJ5169424.1 hypothetical protein N7500_002207 [Penicillium coprophilum]
MTKKERNLDLPVGLGEGKMKKWRVELESQNEQTRGAHTQTQTRMATQHLSIKEAVEGEKKERFRFGEAVLIDYRSLMATSPVAGAETRM